MGIKTFWLNEEIDEDKLKQIAKKQNVSISKLVNNSLKLNYDILKKK